MRFLTILLAALVVWHAGCDRAAEPEVIAAEPEVIAAEPEVIAAEPEVIAAEPDLVAAEPVSGWSGTKKVSRVGRILFAGQPGEAALRHAAAEGFGLVVNLRTTGEMARVPFDEPALVAELGMRYLAIPVMPSTFSSADVDRFAEALATTDGPVLLHCASSNRSGGLWAVHLVRTHGLAWEPALELGKAAGLSRQSMVEAARRVAEGPQRPPA